MTANADRAADPAPPGGVRVGYPPLDQPKPVAADLWVVDSGPMPVYGMKLPIRMTVVRLRSGDLLLHSPTRYTAELHEALAQLGRIRHLIAPNIAHWTFAADWQRACRGTLLWAAPCLAQRRAVRRAALRIDRELGRSAPAEWRGEIDQMLVEGGGGFCEVALFHRSSATLILTDLVVNLEPRKLPAPVALLMRLAGSAAPDGRAPFYLRLLVLLKRKRARIAVRRLIALAPQRVIFAHGRWFNERGTERLRRAMRWLIGDDRPPPWRPARHERIDSKEKADA